MSLFHLTPSPLSAFGSELCILHFGICPGLMRASLRAWRDRCAIEDGYSRSVLDCGSPLPLFPTQKSFSGVSASPRLCVNPLPLPRQTPQNHFPVALSAPLPDHESNGIRQPLQART